MTPPEHPLLDALDDVRAGRRTVDQCLAEHPELGPDLRSLMSLLEAAWDYDAASSIQPQTAVAVRQRLRAAIASNGHRPAENAAVSDQLRRRGWLSALLAAPIQQLTRLPWVGESLAAAHGWLPAVGAGVGAALAGGAVVYAAHSAPPESPLYAVRQALQAVTETLAPQPTPPATATSSPSATATVQVVVGASASARTGAAGRVAPKPPAAREPGAQRDPAALSSAKPSAPASTGPSGRAPAQPAPSQTARAASPSAAPSSAPSGTRQVSGNVAPSAPASSSPSPSAGSNGGRGSSSSPSPSPSPSSSSGSSGDGGRSAPSPSSSSSSSSSGDGGH